LFGNEGNGKRSRRWTDRKAHGNAGRQTYRLKDRGQKQREREKQQEKGKRERLNKNE
jgi:hypothetical protein